MTPRPAGAPPEASSDGHRYDRGPSGELRRIVLTPEGLPLALVVGSWFERAAALVLDVILINFVFALIAIGAAIVFDNTLAGTIAIVAFFVLRNGYFAFFEIHWSGRTPGKRVVGLRVVDADGGPLDHRAVLARNLLREFEFFLPLYLVFGASDLWPDAHVLVRLVAGLWGLAAWIVPFTNRERRRLGDLIGGTMVIRPRRRALRDDVAQRRTARVGSAPDLLFTPEQLALYGVYELQVLEDLLRRPGGPDRATAGAVAERIRQRIGWEPDGTPVGDRQFLEAFYAAQRDALERGLQFGRRKADKHDR